MLLQNVLQYSGGAGGGCTPLAAEHLRAAVGWAGDALGRIQGQWLRGSHNELGCMLHGAW